MTVSDTANGHAQWLTVTEAAMTCRVSERTVRRWVAEQVVQSRVETAGLRESRLILRGSLPASAPTDTPCQEAAAPDGTPSPDLAGHDAGGPRINAATQPLSEVAAMTQRAETAERERDRAFGEVEYLRQELQQRGQEAGELRRLLLQSQHALSLALEQRALPPHTEPVKRRWWFFGRR